jgi:hypothetical protein
VASTSLEPFRHALPGVFLADQFTAVRLEKTSLDFIKKVKTIHGIFDAGVVGKIFQCFQYLLLSSHGNSPPSPRILALHTYNF